MPGGQKFLRQSARKEGTERKRKIERERFRRRQRERDNERERKRKTERQQRIYENKHWKLTQVFPPMFVRGFICTCMRGNKQRPKKEAAEKKMIRNSKN